MLESARRARACRKDLVVTRADIGHFLIGDRAVIERRAPVRPALEHGEITDLVGDLTDDLDGGGAGADDGDLLAGQVERLVRPVEGVERASLEDIHPFQPRRRRHRKQTDRQHDEAAGQFAAVGERQTPEASRFVEGGLHDLAVEAHVFPQVEFFGDAIQVTQIFRLSGEAFLPMPLLEQFLRKRIAIGVAFGIEPRAGIAVPVPGAAEIGGGIQHQCIDPEVGQSLDLVDAGNTGADHDDFVVRFGRLDAAPGHASLHLFLLFFAFLAFRGFPGAATAARFVVHPGTIPPSRTCVRMSEIDRAR